MTRVVAILGPTAVGKSAVAHAIARELGGEIVVADPYQRYRGLEIAADSPSAVDRAEVPYHLVGDLDLAETGTVAAYAQHAHGVIDAIAARAAVPIVSGGSGLYVRAALAELDFPGEPSPDARSRAESLVDADLASAVARLRALDPAAAARVDGANPRRVARALALAQDGLAIPPPDGLWSGATRRPTVIVALTRPREVIHRLIATRVDRELADGLVDELRAALAREDLSRAAAQIIGMREVAALERGELAEDALRERLVVRTRRLARAQATWLRKTPGVVPVDLGDAPALDRLGEVRAIVAG